MLFEPKKRKQSYVGAYFDFNNDAVIIWERDENGNRVVKPYEAPYYFYVPDDNGEYESIFGDKATKVSFGDRDEFNEGVKQYRERFESDISPLFRILMDEYYESDIPRIHYSFLDIEVDSDMGANSQAVVPTKRNGQIRLIPGEAVHTIAGPELYEFYDDKGGAWVSQEEFIRRRNAPGLGFPDPQTPYAAINAVTVWQSWTQKYVTIALLPNQLRRTFDRKKFDKYVANIAKENKLFAVPEVEIARNENELIDGILDAVEDADIISGWNSEFFDLPYIIKRMQQVRPKHIKRLCFPGCKLPREKTVERFGTPSIVFSLNGRTHLDYLDLFKKFTFEGRTSYSLGAITGDELDAPKMEHEGTLEQLFKGIFNPAVDEDFVAWDQIDELRETELERLTMRRSFVKNELIGRYRGVKTHDAFADISDEDLTAQWADLDDEVNHCSFATFCCYNTHDVGCLVGLDEKFKFMSLVNQMAHENTCLFENMTGTVRYVETGITNRAHYVHQKIVMDKKVMTDGEKVEGALVLTPNHGLHKWLGSVDINSLYPSVIRALCISPERYIAQFVNGERDWRGIWQGDDLEHTCVDDSGEASTLTGKEWQEVLRENKWALSAYGTIFDQSQGPGIVDATLAFWYGERKRLKKIMGEWTKKRKALTGQSIELSDEQNAELLALLAG